MLTLLKRSSPEFIYVYYLLKGKETTFVRKAKVPIIRTVIQLQGLQIDISAQNLDAPLYAVRNKELLKAYLKRNPRRQGVILTLRGIIKKRRYGHPTTGGISFCGIGVEAVVALHHRGYIPHVDRDTLKTGGRIQHKILFYQSGNTRALIEVLEVLEQGGFFSLQTKNKVRDGDEINVLNIEDPYEEVDLARFILHQSKPYFLELLGTVKRAILEGNQKL